jgi:hypothetical protein
MFEFAVPDSYHLADPRPCEKVGCDHESFTCSNDRYVNAGMVNWLRKHTKGYYIHIPYDKAIKKTPKPFKVFIIDDSTAVAFRIIYGFPCVKHE